MRKLASFCALVTICALASIAVGIASLLSAIPAGATPPPKCVLEPGDPGCAPCTAWDSHKCACVKIPACKL